MLETLLAGAARELRRATVFSVAVAVLTFSRSAQALESEPDTGFRHGEAPYGWHALVGLHFSRSFGHAAGSGYNLGAEGSVAFLADSFAWLGAYLDAAYAFESHTARMSIGPEVGFLLLGLDGGYLLEFSGTGPRHGATLRVLLTLGVISLFVRSSWLLGSDPDQFGEAGLLLKVPFELK